MSEDLLPVSSRPEEQLEAIHAMLNAGHRGVRLERHSLVLWGVGGAILMFLAPKLFGAEQFPIVWQRASFQLVFLAVVLALVAALDFRMTRRVRRRQGESFPFIQRQMGKVWLLHMALGLMLTFGMHFHGGSAMVYVLWLVLVGTGLFTHGLFSEQSLGWAGAIVISLGVGALALRLPIEGTHWLATLVFGVGLPALGFLLPILEKRALPLRLLFLATWVVLIATGALAAYRVGQVRDRPRAPSFSLAEFRRQASAPREQVVSLPRGTVVPIRLSFQGEMIRQPEAVSVPLELTKNLDLVLVDGKLDGRFRVEGSDWKYYAYDLSIPTERLIAGLTRGDGFAVEYTGRLVTCGRAVGR